MILEQNMFPRRKDRRPQIAFVRSCGPFVRPVVLFSFGPPTHWAGGTVNPRLFNHSKSSGLNRRGNRRCANVEPFKFFLTVLIFFPGAGGDCNPSFFSRVCNLFSRVYPSDHSQTMSKLWCLLSTSFNCIEWQRFSGKMSHSFQEAGNKWRCSLLVSDTSINSCYFSISLVCFSLMSSENHLPCVHTRFLEIHCPEGLSTEASRNTGIWPGALRHWGQA